MLRAACSPLSADLPARSTRWRVLAAFPTALYLQARAGRVLPVVTADALLLPSAWRLPETSAQVSWGVSPGGSVVVDRAGIALPAGLLVAVRQWRPPRVRTAEARRVGLPAAWAAERVGRGPGLTPEGDDELCGALLVAHAVGDPALARALPSLLPRTTSISAELLRAAGEGYAVPALVAYVDACLGGAPTGPLAPAVAAIGSTSGPALLRGVRTALDHVLTLPTGALSA